MRHRIGKAISLYQFLSVAKATLWLMAFIMVSVHPVLVSAQSTTSAVSGTVADATGAIVVGASVVVTNTGTGVASRELYVDGVQDRV
jgi:hypothetical protein